MPFCSFKPRAPASESSTSPTVSRRPSAVPKSAVKRPTPPPPSSDSAWRGNLGLVNRRLQADLDARAKLAGVLRQLRPRVLFAPFWEDAHPDHVAATALVEAARFWAKLTKTDLPGDPFYPQRIVYYFSVHLRIHPRPSFVLDVTEHFETKMRAVECYRSQLIEGRDPTPPTALDDLRARGRYWGWAVGAGYGEPFVCREELGLRGLRDLV